MTTYFNRRTLDQVNLSNENASKDFKTRRPSPIHRVLYKICLLFLFISCVVSFIVYQDNELGAVIFFQVGCLLFVIGKQGSEYQKLLKTKDFLNALFSSALCAGHAFCMIVKRDNGKIIYIDRSFQEMFPDMNMVAERSLETLLNTHVLSPADREAIHKGLKSDSASHIPVQIQGGHDNSVSRSLIFSIEPIGRPEGFCLIRGRL